MTAYLRRCMIVTAAQQAFAQSLCVQLAGDAGVGMFVSSASKTGKPPATHFITEGCVEDKFAGIMAAPENLFAACQQAEPAVTLVQCKALLDSSDLSPDAPFSALNRLGLQLVQEAL